MMGVVVLLFLLLLSSMANASFEPLQATQPAKFKNAYATMMYMGTPRDYEFYTAARVMLGSLLQLHVNADLVVLASASVPPHWQKTL